MQQRTIIMANLVVFLFGAWAASVAQESPAHLQVQTAHGIRYVSGGAGQEEREQLQQLAKDFSVKLTFAVPQGNYLADITVGIRTGQGQTVFETTTPGPWLYVALPPGQYQITATAYDQNKQQTVQVRDRGQAEVKFVWDAPRTADMLITKPPAEKP